MRKCSCPKCEKMTPFDESIPIQKCEFCLTSFIVCPQCEGNGVEGCDGDIFECGRCNGEGLEISDDAVPEIECQRGMSNVMGGDTGVDADDTHFFINHEEYCLTYPLNDI